jgi:hypothetical protein
MLLGGGGDQVGRRLAEFVLGVLENPQSRNVVTGIIRAAASEAAAAAQLRDSVVSRVTTPLAEQLGADRPHLRAALVGSQVVGMTFARHVVEVPALRSAERAELVDALARVFDVYLRGDIGPGR